MKTVYICHPIGGDVKNNVQKVTEICSKIHNEDIIPVVPYLVSLQYLDDEVKEDRELGIDANLECFHRKYIDEVWLYGNRISPGMKQEILIARKYGVPVIAKTEETEKELKNLI
jgi:hypothetical protein